MGWVLAIHSKDRALSATKEFLTYVSNQYNTQVKGWMFNAGREFKSAAYKQLMRDHVSAIIKKEESPLVVPLLFEETGDAKKEDCQSPSLSSYQTRSPIEPARGYTPRAPSYYNPSTPVRSPSLLPEPIDWEQILVIPRHPPASDDGSSTVVESIGEREYNWVYYKGNKRDVVRRSVRELSRHVSISKRVYSFSRDLRAPILILALIAAGLAVPLLPLFYIITFLVFNPLKLSTFLRVTVKVTIDTNRLVWGPRLRRTNPFQRPSNPAPSDADSEGDPLPDLEDVE
ncbi:hypothetical protein OG21DRAFT_1491018 [Imleria badia]|nr:hypothetical protein OG21DRAFT_1491018 [Imleria badia]